MIQIVKPATIPKSLVKKGVKQKATDCKDFDLCQGDYISGNKKFKALRKIYGHSEVKEALMKAHYNKCCYCERCFDDPANLHIEHYRPKGAVKQKQSDKETFPGYYWLAYDWDNLFLSCHPCNSSHKGDLFPLANPACRTASGLSHRYDISKEKPLFVNPASDDPREHIRFKKHVPYHVTKKGRITIKELKLDTHTPILKARLEKIALLDAMRQVVELSEKQSNNIELADIAQKFRVQLAAAILPSAPLSSMAKDHLKDYFDKG